MPIEDEYDGLNYVNGTILIVTDEVDINIVLSGVFGLNGFKTFKCTSAEEALEVLDEHVDEIDSMLIDGKIAEYYKNGKLLGLIKIIQTEFLGPQVIQVYWFHMSTLKS